jgi:hypothetical protein
MFNFLQLKLSLLASIFGQSQSYLCFGLFGDKDLVPGREQIVFIFHRNQWPLREYAEMTIGRILEALYKTGQREKKTTM